MRPTAIDSAVAPSVATTAAAMNASCACGSSMRSGYFSASSAPPPREGYAPIAPKTRCRSGSSSARSRKKYVPTTRLNTPAAIPITT